MAIKNLEGIRVLILGDASGAVRAMMDVDKRAGSLVTNLQRTGKMMMGLGAGVLTTIGAGTLAMGRNAEGIIKQAKEVGMAADDFQRYSYSVQMAGASADDFTRNMTILRWASVAAVDGNKTAIALFDRLGVSFKNADGSARNTKDIILDMSDALAKGKIGPEQMAAAVQLLGRGGKELIQWMMQGKQAIMAMAAATPNVISNEDLKKLKDFNELVLGLKIKLIGVTSEGLVKITPYLEKFIGFISKLADKFEALSPETKAGIGQFVMLGSVALIAGGGLFFLLGKITAVVDAARGLASIGTFLSGVNPTILMVVAGLLGIWSIASSIAGIIDKERARKGKEEIVKNATARGYYTPEETKKWKELDEMAKGPKWGPISTMRIATEGFGLMMGDMMNKYLPGQPAVIPTPASAGVPSGIGYSVSGLPGGWKPALMPLPAFGASAPSTSQMGKVVYVDFKATFDKSEDAVDAMADQVNAGIA